MSGWDASRPTRDPQRHESGTGPRQAGGAPPDIFEREYGAQAYSQQPYGQPDGRADYSQPEYGQPGYGQPEYGQPDHGAEEFPPRRRAEHGDGRQTNGHGRHGRSSRPAPAQDGYPGQDYSPWQPDQQDFGQQDFGQQDYGRPGGQPGFGQLDREQPDFGQFDREQPRFGQQDRQLPGFGQLDREQPDYGQPNHRQPNHGESGYAGRDYAGRDARGGDTADSTYAAQMDPALQDFFKPVPPARDFSPSGPQPRMPGQSRQPGQPGEPGQQRNGQPFPPTQPHRPSRPELGRGAPTAATPWDAQEGGPARANGTDRWDTDTPRPGSRSARRQEDRQHPPGRGRTIAGVAIGVVVVVGIAAVAYKVLDKKNASTPAASSTPPAVSPSQHQSTPAASHPATSTGGQSSGYTLSAPASAAGYSKLATAPSAVSNDATATAQAIREQAVNAGGKATGQVTGYYQLTSGQVMSFVGYEGTFNPDKVLAALGSDWATFPAGQHGGDLACDPSAGTPGGTTCVWITPTTLGVTEFFGSTGSPEMVTEQAKAAQDTVNVRADVEAAKS